MHIVTQEFFLKGQGNISVVQRFLPPQTSLVSRRILDDSDTSYVQIDQVFLRAPQGERRQGGSTWSACCCKTRNISLQRCGDRPDYVWVRAAKEGITNVLPMKRWWNAELIGVSFSMECSVEVVGVASEFMSWLFSASRSAQGYLLTGRMNR